MGALAAHEAEDDGSRSFMVVHVAETIRGGIASYLREILNKQVVRYGAGRIAVLTVREQIGDLGVVPGVLLIPVSQRKTRLATALALRRALRSLLKSEPTDVLHVHSSFAGLACRVLPFARRRARALVYCPHGWAFLRDGRERWVTTVIERLLERSASAIVCVSHSERESAIRAGISSGKLRVIYNGLPDRPLTVRGDDGLEGRPLRLIFVGRLDRQKAFDVVLAALKLVRRPVEIDVFGESVVGGRNILSVPESVRMHGWQPFNVIERTLAMADALVMPSRWEALGISAIESMRAGTAVIASRVGGLPELVTDGVTGYLVPPGNPEALASVINTASKIELADMGMRGRTRFMQKFVVDKCESELAELYAEVLST